MHILNNMFILNKIRNYYCLFVAVLLTAILIESTKTLAKLRLNILANCRRSKLPVKLNELHFSCPSDH